MMKSLIAGLIIATVGANTAFAGDHHPGQWKNNTHSYKHGQPDHPYNQHLQHHQPGVTYARVTRVEPITRTLTHRVPEQTCWDETVRYESSRSSATPALVGGIIGAAIGRNLGKGHHRDNRNIKTIALGALGASIGHDLGRKNSHESVHYGTERRCDVSYQTRYQEEVVGYHVSYRYDGKTYHTKMDYHPGKKIPVKVKVRPIL